MTTPLRNYPEAVRERVAHRRDQAQTGGLGYWAARDALKKLGIAPTEKKGARRENS